MNKTYVKLTESLPIEFELATLILSIIAIIINAITMILIHGKSSMISSNMAITCSCCCAAICFAMLRAADSILPILAFSKLNWFLRRCVFDNITLVSFESVYNIHIAILSLEKFHLLLYPFKHQRIATKANITKLLLVVWFIPGVSLFFMVKIAAHTYCRCCLEWFSVPILKTVMQYGIIPIVFFIPPFITVLFYAVILCKLHQTLNPESYASCRHSQYQRHKISFKNKKAFIQASITITMYILTFMPMLIIIYIINRSNSHLFIIPFCMSNMMISLFLCLHPITIICFNASLKSEARRRLLQYFQCCQT